MVKYFTVMSLLIHHRTLLHRADRGRRHRSAGLPGTVQACADMIKRKHDQRCQQSNDKGSQIIASSASAFTASASAGAGTSAFTASAAAAAGAGTSAFTVISAFAVFISAAAVFLFFVHCSYPFLICCFTYNEPDYGNIAFRFRKNQPFTKSATSTQTTSGSALRAAIRSSNCFHIPSLSIIS